MPSPLPRITYASSRYEVLGRHTVDVILSTGEAFEMTMTHEQYRRTRNLVVDTGSAPVPTGEHV